MAAPEIARACLQCGSAVPPVPTGAPGRRAAVCSDECRAARKKADSVARYLANPQKWVEYGRQRRRQNPEAIREYQRAWVAKNLEAVRARGRKAAAARVKEAREWLDAKLVEDPDYRKRIHRRWKARNLAREQERQRQWTRDNLERERARKRDAARVARALRGKKDPVETRAKRSESLKRAWAEGRHPVNKSYRYTSLAQALHRYLQSERGLTLEPEVRFGRFTVDLYDRAHHVAYEADGAFWHEKNERARPGCHAERDAYLRERFGLDVIHYTDKQIRELTRRRVA